MAFVGSLSGSVGTIAVTGSFVPGADNTYSIGTSGAKWSAVVASQLTGSLTKLADASDYLIAGTNVSLSTGSNGAVTITATSTASTPGGSNTYVQYNADGAFGGKSSFAFASGTDTLSVTNVSATSISATSLTASFVTSSGDFLIAGDVAINGGDLTTTATTATLFNLNATTLNVGGAATTLGIGSSAGTTTVNNSLVVKGDLYISGTTTTIDSTVVEIQDPVIGLGFASGSVAGTAGDRGFIGGITGAGNNVAFVWSNSNSTFAATKTVTAPGSAPVSLSVLQPIRVGSLQVNGTAAYITSSDAQTLELNGAASKGIKFTVGAGTQFAQFVDNGANAEFGAISNKQLNLSGSQVNLNAGSNGIFFQKNGTAFAQVTGNSATLSITPQAGFLTASIVNTVADLINFGGAATVINVGNAAGTVTFNGNINANGNTTLGNATSDRVAFNAYVTSSILPSDDLAFTLGSQAQRWQHIYTGDLHLRNDRGDYTLIEEEDFLSIRFNKTGKRYKFLLEAVPELDEK